MSFILMSYFNFYSIKQISLIMLIYRLSTNLFTWRPTLSKPETRWLQCSVCYQQLLSVEIQTNTIIQIPQGEG